MPVAPEPPAEGEASINIAPTHQPCDILMFEGDSNALLSEIEIGNSSISANSGVNAGNWNQEPPTDLNIGEESIL